MEVNEMILNKILNKITFVHVGSKIFIRSLELVCYISKFYDGICCKAKRKVFN